MLNCFHCGQENRIEAVFCRNCGQPLQKEGLFEEASPAGKDPEPLSEAAGQPIPELAVGTILGGRYRIRSKLENHEYEADDLLSCWSCGSIQSAPDQHFCEVCGAELPTWPQVILQAQPQLSSSSSKENPNDIIEAGVCYRVKQKELVVEDQPQAAPLRLLTGFQSHPGKIRDNNEDSLITLSLAALCDTQCPPVIGFYAVADGVGGAESGEVASELAVRYLAGSVIQRLLSPGLTGASMADEELPGLMNELIISTNRAILELRSQMEERDMGSTLTGVVVRGSHAVVANVGDSRTYWLHQGKLGLVTQDHSVVARLVEQGLIQPEEVYTHQQRSIIYRSLGSRSDLEVDVFSLELEPGDRLLLCSDGLWEMVRDGMIEEVLLDRNDPQQACDRLVELANLAGGDDNISVIVVNVQS